MPADYVNPKRNIDTREGIAARDSAPAGPAAAKPAPTPNGIRFEKPRDHSKDKAGLEKALRNRKP